MKLVKHLINGEVVSMGDPTQDVYNPRLVRLVSK